MSWAELHQKSERLAAEAQASVVRTQQLYVEAAVLETQALDAIAPGKQRTFGVTAVSAVALWFKAHRFSDAQQLAYRILASGHLPPFAVKAMQELLQAAELETKNL